MNKRLENVATVKRYTLINKKEKNKIDERDIYANASNCGAENTAITLIALIITIIVLLILAGVTLNMVMGENGIFGKANNAKNKTEVAQYEEELRMCVLELQTDAATNGTTFNMETIKNKFVEKVKELENTTEIEFPTEESETRLDGTYKGYEFYIDEKYVAHIGDKATGIQLTISLNPSGWTNQNVTATITIKSNNGIRKIVPQGESEITLNGEKEYTITKSDIAENTTFAYEVTDSQNNTQTKTAIINTIDKEPPQDFQIEAEVTEEGLKITGTTTDAESGIDKYEYYAKKSTDSDYTKYDSNPITGLESGTYNVYAKAYDKAGNEKQSTNTLEKKVAVMKNITAEMVAKNPEIYYGLTVKNYESQNGQKDWKIFYSNWKENSEDAHIFLITSGYVDLSQENKLNPNTGMKIFGEKYGVSWQSEPQFQSTNSAVLNRFQATEYDINNHKEDISAKCTSTLLNASNWEKYKDNKGKAEYSIGSPTIEMWVNSWNNLYKNIDGEIKYTASDNQYMHGYSVTNGFLSSNNKVGVKNKLYFPRDILLSDGNIKLYGYMFASPSGNGFDQIVYCNRVGQIGPASCIKESSEPYCALRPVVSLNKDITVDAIDSE